MISNSQPIIIDNYFIYVKKENITNFSLFQPLGINFNIKKYLTKKRQGPESKIIIKEEENDEKYSESKNIQFSAEESSLSYSEKTNSITIEIDSKESNIFKVIEDNSLITKMGRKPKDSNQSRLHTKFSYDNILRKIKAKFMDKLIKFINSIIIKNNRQIKLLKPIIGKFSQDNNIVSNRKILNSTLKDIFSSYEVNRKCSSIDKYYNRDVINSIYQENIKELIDILEMSFLQIFDIFRDLNERNKLNGLDKLDKVINELKLKEEDEEYINKFTETVNNYEKFYFNKKERKKKIIFI